MKRTLLLLLSYALSLAAQDAGNVPYRTGEAAGFASKDSTALSMMSWGVALAAGIATLCALIPDNSDSSHSH